MSHFIATFVCILKLHMRSEWAQPERLLSLVLFSLSLQILFTIGLGDLSQQDASLVANAQLYLTIFLAMQIAFLRLFETEEQDRSFDLLSIHSHPVQAWYVAKVTTITTIGFLVAVFVSILVTIMIDDPSVILLSTGHLTLALLVIHAMSGLGTLISAMTLSVQGRQILFPILYFPLTIPVLLCGLQSSLYLAHHPGDWLTLFSSWIGLLLIFDIVYFGLGMIFFDDLLRSSR